jgi:hypothetical protein
MIDEGMVIMGINEVTSRVKAIKSRNWRSLCSDIIELMDRLGDGEVVLRSFNHMTCDRTPSKVYHRNSHQPLSAPQQLRTVCRFNSPGTQPSGSNFQHEHASFR